MTRRTRTVSIAALLVTAFAAGAFFVTSAGSLPGLPDVFQSADAQRTADLEDAVAVADDLGQAFSAVAERVNPAVVQIRATKTVAQNPMRGPRSGSSPLDYFFQQPPGGGQPFEQSGLGSGAFIREDGYIVTNNHVIEDASDLRVSLFDGRELPAELVGADPFSDLAVLKVDGDDFPALSFGEADETRVGQWVLAFGSPLSEDLSNTVTSGIISSLGRFSGGSNSISNYIQTDAAVNPGNSGGPLVNLRGEIIGINSAIATRSGGFQGISFAIPVDIVANTINQIVDTGAVERGYLGIQFGPVTPSLARALDVQNGAAQISAFSPDATGTEPARAAGLREGDVIVAADGVRLRQHTQIISIVSNKRPGDTVELTYNRDGREATAEVQLGTRPGADAIAAAQDRAAPAGPSRAPSAAREMESLGLTVEPLSPELARQYRIEDATEGVVITDVERSSDAYREARLRPGLVITEVDREPVATVEEFEAAVEAVRPGDTFIVRLRSAGGTIVTALTKPS